MAIPAGAIGQRTDGSYIYGPGTPTPVPTPTQPKGGRTLVSGATGAPTNTSGVATNAPQYQPSYTPPSSPTTGGGGGGGNPPEPQGPSDSEINAIFAPTIDFLNKARSTIQGQQSGIESDINSLVGESQNTLTSERDISSSQLDEQQRQGDVRKEDAITAARRLYNEVVRGGQQRFGGSSSAGEAFQALSGVELQRNRQGIQQQSENFMQQIALARQSLQERYTTAIANLESQKTRMLSEARRQFQDRLLEVDRLKAETEAEKSRRRLDALQQLRNQVFQIRLNDYQERQKVDTLASNLTQEIDSFGQVAGEATSTGQGALGDFYNNAPVEPQTTVVADASQRGQGFNPVGVAQGRDEDMFGAVNPLERTNRDLFGQNIV